MPIQAISSAPSFTSNSAPTNTETKPQQQSKLPDKKKLLIGGLVALGCAAVAGIAIAKSKKVPDKLSIEEFKKIGQFDKGVAKAKGKLFSGEITVPNNKGKTVLTYKDGNLAGSIKYKKIDMPEPLNEGFQPIWKKVYSTKDGAKTVETYGYNILAPENNRFNLQSTTKFENNKITTTEKTLLGEVTSKVEKQADGTILSTKEELNLIKSSPRGIRRNTINTKTGKIIDSKLELAPKPPKEKGTLRKTENGVTTKNGKTFATKTETIDEKGNKIITVDYGEPNEKRVITIAPDGKRTDTGKSNKVFNL